MVKERKIQRIKHFSLLGFTILIGIALLPNLFRSKVVSAQDEPGRLPSDLTSLTNIPTPQPDNLAVYVRDNNAAIALGKALFWEMQAGSDGVQSCASCHFHAGADNRSINQLDPGLNRVNADGSPNPDHTFQTGPPNYHLTAADYPFHRLADINNRNSTVLFDSNDITGSQGVFNSTLLNIAVGSAQDNVLFSPDPEGFSVNGINVRRVEPRNTPTVINAVFNFRNFWDGRAQEDFNGANPFGARDPNPRIMDAYNPNNPTLVRPSLNRSSLASQAVGPPVSENEMSARCRFWPDIGRKLLALSPLAQQKVATDDSVLGPYANPSGNGLSAAYTYGALIQQAFQPRWWQDTTHVVTIPRNCSSPFAPFTGPTTGSTSANSFNQMETNFSLYWGIAIQMYEATLRSDQTPFDNYANGNTAALTVQQRQGLDIFTGQGKCINCHAGAEFTKASFRSVVNQKIERMIMGDGGVAVYDNGFYNIGVRPTNDDRGVGGIDPFGNPLSFSRFFQQQCLQNPANCPVVQGEGEVPSGTLSPTERVAVDGAFKTAGLRNVELTAPYFHNGGQLSVRQVVDFYNRGGDFHDQNIANLDPDIENLGLTEAQKDSLVAFLASLTDERVRLHKAPFDHPSLKIPNGHPDPLVNDGTGKAIDQFIELPAVGSGGLAAPIRNFPAFQASLSLNGAGAHASVPNSTALNITGPVTLEAWVKTNNATAQQGVIERWGLNDGGYALRLQFGKVMFGVVNHGGYIDGAMVFGNTTISAGVWHHIAGIYDGTQYRVYLDGVLDGAQAATTVVGSGTNSLKIGGRGDDGTMTFNGLIDEARVIAGVLYTGNNFTPQRRLTATANTRGWWRFDDLTVKDASGNAQNGSLVSRANFAADTPTAHVATGNHSLSLNGTSAYATVPYSASLNITGPVTLEAWVKTNNATAQQGVIERWGLNDGGYALRLQFGKVMFGVVNHGGYIDGAMVFGNTTISAGVWHHIAGIYDGTQYRVYLDGVLDGAQAATTVVGSGTNSLKIGGRGDDGTMTFNGLIDEGRVTAGVLYTGNFTPQAHLGPVTGTVGAWKFDGQTLNDLSVNGNNGLLIGGATFSTDAQQ